MLALVAGYLPLDKPTGERDWIAALRRRAQQPAAIASRSPIRLGIGDDCALLRPSAREEIVLTTDLLLERVHFRRDWHPPESVGHRCLARGLSDIASMGARPTAALLSLALPRELAGVWVQRFLDGMLALAARHRVPLIGGDTAEAPPAHRAAGASLFAADVVLVGALPRGTALLRSGAQPGDQLYVTGLLGGAAAELAHLASAPRRFGRLRRAAADHPHLFPQPRLAQAVRLRKLASSAIDLSDGLSTDLAHLCEESGVAAEIDASLVPIHPLAAAAGSRGSPLDLALNGGEDYELLFTARPGVRVPRSIAGVPLGRIGSVLPQSRRGSLVILIEPGGKRRPLPNRGWEHFRARHGR